MANRQDLSTEEKCGLHGIDPPRDGHDPLTPRAHNERRMSDSGEGWD